MKESTKSLILLSLLSPLFAEVLSGSTPPLEVITQPLSFPLLWAFYGGAVIITREVWVRWGGRYGSLMFLGFAYGVFEEGIIIRSWYNPGWPDLGILASYGRFWGINVTWAVWLTIFHSLMSITAPIVVVNSIYPNLEKSKLLDFKGIAVLLGIVALSSGVFLTTLGNYNPPIVQYSISFILLFLFIAFAWRGVDFKHSLKFVERHPVIYGFLVALLLFLTFTFIPRTSIIPLVPMLLGILIVVHMFSQMHVLKDRYSIIFGFLSFWFVPYDLALELNGVRGELLFGVVAFIFLYLHWRRRKN